MKNVIRVFIAVLVATIIETHAQEAANPNAKQFAASVRDIKGACYVREGEKAQLQRLKPKEELRAGQQLSCSKGGYLKIVFHRSRGEKEIKQNLPNWYVIPNVPSGSEDELNRGGRYAKRKGDLIRVGHTPETEKVTLQYRVARDAVAPSRFVAVSDKGISAPLHITWDLPKAEDKKRGEFDALIKTLEDKQINGVEFECMGEWLMRGATLRVTTVPQLTEEGKKRITEAAR
jgi:hypothetical protein